MNVDAADIERFEAYSSEWWDEKGPTKPLHSMNKIRIPFIRDGLIKTGFIPTSRANDPDVFKGIKILDVGCGAGILSEALGQFGATVVGLEPSAELIQVAKSHLKGKPYDVQYISSTIEEHAISNAEQYDAVVASEVLEHVPGQKEFLLECVKCLKPGGSIYVTTLNKTIASLVGAKIFAEYVLGLIPKGTHDWKQFISPKNVSNILETANCKTTLVRGMGYNIFNDVFSFSRLKWINYALHAVKNVNED